MQIIRVDEKSLVDILEQYSDEDEYGRTCYRDRVVSKKPSRLDYGLYFRDEHNKIVRLTPDCRILPAYRNSHSFKNIVSADIVGEIGLGYIKADFPIEPVLHISEINTLDVFRFNKDLVESSFFERNPQKFSYMNTYVFLHCDDYSIGFCDLGKNMFYVKTSTVEIFVHRYGELTLGLKNEQK